MVLRSRPALGSEVFDTQVNSQNSPMWRPSNEITTANAWGALRIGFGEENEGGFHLCYLCFLLWNGGSSVHEWARVSFRVFRVFSGYIRRQRSASCSNVDHHCGRTP